MRKWLVLLPLLALGCKPPITKLEIPNISKSSGVIIEDVRPEPEKKNEIMSLLVTSEAYGINRKGDETLDPPMVRIFQHRAFEKFNSSIPGFKIKLHHMVTYLNMKSALRKGALFGVIGTVVVSANSKPLLASEIVDSKKFEESNATEHKRALYTEKENPDKTSIFVIYIESEINGKRVFTKTMSSTKVPEGQNPHSSAVDAAIEYHLAQY
jgi:hypothetical protein